VAVGGLLAVAIFFADASVLRMAGRGPSLDRLNPTPFRRKSNAREVGAHDSVCRKTAVFDRFPVISYRESTTRNLPRPLAFCTDSWNEACKHQIFCSNPLRHRTQIGGAALPIKIGVGIPLPLSGPMTGGSSNER
jgi:hypothetical protein